MVRWISGSITAQLDDRTTRMQEKKIQGVR